MEEAGYKNDAVVELYSDNFSSGEELFSSRLYLEKFLK